MTQLQELRGRMDVLKGWLGTFLQDAKDGSGDLNVKAVAKIGDVDVSKMGTADKLGEYRKLDSEMNDLAPQIDTLAKIELESENAKRAKIEKEKPKKDGNKSLSKWAIPTVDIVDLIMDSVQLKAWQKSGQYSKGIAEGVKADFTRSAGWAPESLRTGRVTPSAIEPTTVIDTIPPGQTGMAKILYMAETTHTNAAAERAEAAVYAESTFEYTEQSVDVQTIGHILPVTDEVLADEPTLASILDSQMRGGLRDRLNSQMIAGSGSGNQIRGLFNATDKTTETNKVAATTILDYIYAVSENVRTTGWANPNAMYLRSANWMTIRTAKTTDNAYLLGRPDESDPTRIWGMLPVLTNAITANHVMTVDTTYTQLFTRSGVEVQLGYNSDDFGKGKQSIRAGVRVALVVYRGTAVAEGGALNT